MGSDVLCANRIFSTQNFDSRLPAWGAIQPDRQDRQYHLISILVPRVGSDNIESHAFIIIINFNSRSLRVERYHGISAAGAPVDFNSRFLRGERYVTRQSNIDIIVISILDSCVGSGRNVLPDARDESDFNSRSLHGERYQEDNVILFDLKTSILVPCVGSDDELLREAKASTISILAPRIESDRIRPVRIHQNAFSILAPRMGSDPSNFVLHDLFLFQFSLPVWGAT